MNATHGGPALSLLVIAEPGVDVADLLREVYRDEWEDTHFGAQVDQLELEQCLVGVWSGRVCADPARVAWRLGVAFPPSGEVEGEYDVEFANAVVQGVLSLGRDSPKGILAIVKLADPVQLRGHTSLYAEVYAIEMALREVVSYVFAAEFPEELVDGLMKTNVKPANSENMPPDDQLVRYGENRFFYILFDKYAILNLPGGLTVADIGNALKEAASFDDVRKALDMRPIKNERHAGFLASLQDLMDPLEKVRNAVAHNRTVSERVRGNFNKAAERLRGEIEGFWAREVASMGPTVPPVAPTQVGPAPAAG